MESGRVEAVRHVHVEAARHVEAVRHVEAEHMHVEAVRHVEAEHVEVIKNLQHFKKINVLNSNHLLYNTLVQNKNLLKLYTHLSNIF